jgi:hypothetical protein
VIHRPKDVFGAVDGVGLEAYYQVRQGRTWSRSYKSPSSPPSPPARFRILVFLHFFNFAIFFLSRNDQRVKLHNCIRKAARAKVKSSLLIFESPQFTHLSCADCKYASTPIFTHKCFQSFTAASIFCCLIAELKFWSSDRKGRYFYFEL